MKGFRIKELRLLSLRNRNKVFKTGIKILDGLFPLNKVSRV